MYIVVFRNIADCETKGAITWTALKSQKHFQEWYNDEKKRSYEVVEEGVSQERAKELCSSPEAIRAQLNSILNESERIVKSLFFTRIVVTKRADDYHACIEERSNYWGCGRTINEAIGDLIRSHGEKLCLEVQYGDHETLLQNDRAERMPGMDF